MSSEPGALTNPQVVGSLKKYLVSDSQNEEMHLTEKGTMPLLLESTAKSEPDPKPKLLIHDKSIKIFQGAPFNLVAKLFSANTARNTTQYH